MNHLDLERVRAILAGFEGKRILVIGDAMLDRYLWGEAARISPEAPVPVVETISETHRLGGAANVALNIATLGGRAELVAVRGEDEEGRRLLDLLDESGIPPDGVVVDSGRATTLKTRIVARGQQVVRVDRESRAEVSGGVLDAILARARSSSEMAEAVIISDYGKGVVTAGLLADLLPRWRTGRLPVCVDPKETHLTAYRGVTVITPNQSEAGWVYGRRIRDLRTLEEVGLGLLRRLESEAVLITRGDEGMSLFTSGDRVLHFPTVGTEVFDVTGAGDTVVSALAMALVAGAELPEGVVISNHAAGIVIREMGTAAVSREEILASFHEQARSHVP